MLPPGKVFYALGTDTMLCFVPDTLLHPWDEEAFLAAGWGMANARANPRAIGSHVLPNVDRPAPDSPQVTAFRKKVWH